MSLAVSLVFIILLRFTAGFLLWITIVGVTLLLAYGESCFYFLRMLQSSCVRVCACVCSSTCLVLSTDMYSSGRVRPFRLVLATLKACLSVQTWF